MFADNRVWGYVVMFLLFVLIFGGVAWSIFSGRQQRRDEDILNAVYNRRAAAVPQDLGSEMEFFEQDSMLHASGNPSRYDSIHGCIHSRDE